jgi:hypothetical protein
LHFQVKQGGVFAIQQDLRVHHLHRQGHFIDQRGRRRQDVALTNSKLFSLGSIFRTHSANELSDGRIRKMARMSGLRFAENGPQLKASMGLHNNFIAAPTEKLGGGSKAPEIARAAVTD